MANLETLELTINANAGEATRGIGHLINSLSSLSAALTKPLESLQSLNKELSKLRSLSSSVNFKIGATGIASGSAARVKSLKQETEAQKEVTRRYKEITGQIGKFNAAGDYATKDIGKRVKSGVTPKSWEYGPNKPPTVTTYKNSMLSEEESRQKNPQWYKTEQEWRNAVIERNEALRRNTQITKDNTETKKIAEKIDKEAVKITKQEAKEIRDASSAQQDLEKEGEEQKSTLEKLKESFKELGKGASNVFNRIRRIATTMLIRSAIKGMIKAIKEGTSNLYEWSKQNNQAFSSAVDTIKAKTLEVKNSVGAAIAPAIAAAIPVINALASAAITAFNAVNQLLALLSGGGSWTKATQGANNFAEAAKGAGGAASEWLAKFDELNVMNSGGGGGGGGSAIDYSNMFEEVTEFDQGIRDLVNFINENMESIKASALAIGVALAAWELGTAFAESLPLLSTIFGYIGTGATIAVTLQLDWMFMNEYLDTGKEGWLFASILTTAVGSTAAWAIANKLIGGSAGAYAAAITLTLSAVTDLIALEGATDVSTLSKESIASAFKTALEGGAAAGILYQAAGKNGIATLKGAGGVALITFSIAMGLKAALDETQAEVFTLESLGTMIAAAIGTGIGVSIMGGSILLSAGAGFLTLAILTAIRLTTNKKNVDSSGIHLTDEQVEEFVETKMFNIPVKATLKLISEHLEVSEAEKEKIKEATIKAIGELKVISLGLATTETYSNLETDLNNLVSATKNYINAAKEEGKFTLEFTPKLAGETELEQGEWFTNYNLGWDEINKFVEDKGKKIGELIVKGEKNEISASETELLQTLMTQLTNVTNAITQAGIDSEAFAGLKISLADLDEESAEKVVEKFKEYKDKLTDEYTELVNSQYKKQGQLAEALFLIDPESELYQKAVEDYTKMGENLADAVKDGVEKAAESGTAMIKEWLLGKEYDFKIADTELQGFIDAFDLTGAIRETLQEYGKADKYIIEALDLVGFSGWELLSKDLQEQFLKNIQIKPETIAEIKAANIPASDVIKFVKWNELSVEEAANMKSAFVNTFGSEGIAALKSVIPNISAKSIVSVVEWDKLSGDAMKDMVTALVKEFGEDGIAAIKSKMPTLKAKSLIDAIDWSGFTEKETKHFTESIKSIFDSEEATKAAKSAGKTAGKNIGAGMDDNLANQKHTMVVDSKFGKDSGPKELGKEVSAVKPTIKAILTAPQKQKDGLKKDIQTGVKPNVNVKTNTTKNDLNNLSNTIHNNVTPTVSVTPLVGNALLDKNITKKIEAIKATVTATPKLSDTASLKTAFKNAFTASLSMRSNGSNIGTISISAAAEGGMFNSADLFVANENGVPELIGKVGNQTGVANTEQMVEAMARGVRGANEEQNNLLRQQNNLLARIANKEWKIGASSSLGRVAMQSIDMYSSAMGV